MSTFPRLLRSLLLALLIAGNLVGVAAAQTAAPTIVYSQVTKSPHISGAYRFTFYIDAADKEALKDYTGTEGPIEYRARVSTNPSAPASSGGYRPWQAWPLNASQPIYIDVACTFFHFEVRAVPKTGSASEATIKEFKAPFPLLKAPAAPSFKAALNLEGGGETVDHMVADRDLDGDGTIDVAQADRATGTLTLRRNVLGTGKTFATQTFPFAATTLDDVATGKISGLVGGGANDSLRDLVVAHGATLTVKVQQAQSGSQLTYVDQDLTLPTHYLKQVAVGDLNGDGFDDVAAEAQPYEAPNEHSVAVFLNRGLADGGGFLTPTLTTIGHSINDLQLVDLNNDSKLDMVVATGSSIWTYQNDGSGSFSGAPQVESTYYGEEAHSVAFADLTGDNFVEMIVGSFGISAGGDTLYKYIGTEVYLNDGLGGFTFGTYLDVSHGTVVGTPPAIKVEVATGDLNGDGAVDLIASHDDSAKVKLFTVKPIFYSDGKVYALLSQGTHSVSSKAPVRTLGLGDLNRDGKLDLVTSNSSPTFQTSVLLNATAVKAVKPNFFVIPSSTGKPWGFAFQPTSTLPDSIVTLQVSSDGVEWTNVAAGLMTKVDLAAAWVLATADFPAGSHYFRAVSKAPGALPVYSTVFSNFLLPTTGLKVSTKSPPKKGQQWTFIATQKSIAPDMTVRFQSTLTPADEGSWTDVPTYTPTKQKGSIWTLVTFNIPAGKRYFRAITAAPGWVDSISAHSVEFDVAESALILPPITDFTVAADGKARTAEPVTFSAVQAATGGGKLRFQTKLSSDLSESAWTDLPDGGAIKKVGTKWTFVSLFVPSGVRDFRAISSATGYLDNVSETISKTVSEPRPPQAPAAFTAFTIPSASQRIFKTGQKFHVQLGISDPNGLQSVRVQVATPNKPFVNAGSGTMHSLSGNGIYLTDDQQSFDTPGTKFLRVAAVDNHSPSQTNYSEYITLEIGLGDGTTSPSFGAFDNSFVQSTRTSKGSVTIRIPVGDDKAVRRVYLQRVTTGGTVVSSLGEMKQATSGNLSVYSLSHSELDDGTYYYRAVAMDYDGNLAGSPITSAFNLVTPIPPPPAPIIINIEVETKSRLVNPTFPVTNKGARVKYNHPDMPLPDHGMVTFSYSGLPEGTSEIVIFKPEFGSSQPFYNKTITNTSGTLTIKAPSLYRGETQGEGDYEIQIYRGGQALALSSNQNKFTVGHSWNQPKTFTRLDYGLYWFKDVRNGLKALGAGQNDQYFDPSKPTVIYVHGWQFNEVGLKRRESWQRTDPVKGVDYDLCKIWKDQGYNVGLFYWNQFGWDPALGLYKSEAKIYGSTGDKGDLPAGEGMTYALYSDEKDVDDGSINMAIWWNPEEIGNKNIADLFYADYERCFAGYSTSTSKELRLIGHSLGTQVIGRTMHLINTYRPPGVPLPTRIALLDLAYTNTTTLPDYPGNTVPQLQKSFISGLAGAGVAIESYQSTDLQSFLGIIGVAAKPVYDATAYARIRPDWIPPLSVADSHGEVIRWYSRSFKYVGEFPTWSYRAPFWKNQEIGTSISATSSYARIRSLMGGNLYFNQTEGKNSVTLDDDEFEEKTDRN